MPPEPSEEAVGARGGGVEGGVEVEEGGGAEEVLTITVEDGVEDRREEVSGISSVAQSLIEDRSQL